MFYIVGLGNPGEKYVSTRHNVGFLVLDHLVNANGLPSPVVSGKYSGKISEGILEGEEVTLLYPDTYMNMSGSAVKKLVPKGEEGNLVVIYDDVDLPVGEIKISMGRGAGGHNGIGSIIDALGTKEFMRIRIGIAPKGFFGNTIRPKGQKLSRHVLGGFRKKEMKQLEDVMERACGALHTIVTESIEKAMNKFN